MFRKLLQHGGEFSRREFGISLIIVSLATMLSVLLAIFLRVRTNAVAAGAPSMPLLEFFLSASGFVLLLAIPYVGTVSMMKRLRNMGRSGWFAVMFWAIFIVNMFAHGRWLFTGLPVFRLLFVLSLLGIVSFLGWLIFTKPRKDEVAASVDAALPQ